MKLVQDAKPMETSHIATLRALSADGDCLLNISLYTCML